MKKLLSLVLALLMVLGMAACGGSKPAESAAPAAPAAPAASGEAAPAAPVENWKKEVIIAQNSKFTHQDPHGATNFQNTRHYQLVYDRLVYLDTVTQKLEPMLARSSIQLMRLVSVVSAAPMMMRFILSKWKSGNSEINENTKKQNISKRKKSLATTLAIGLAGGIIGKISGFPAGTMSLAMIVVVIYNIRTGEAYMPIKVRRVAQCFNGAIIGTQLMLADLLLLKMIFPIVAVLTLGWLAVNLILGWILHKFGKLTPETALFATAPGGMSDMGLIAAEMGGNAVQVSVLQMCRVICVIALSPAIAKMIY